MFETLTLTTLLLVAFFFYQNMSLGLTSAVPKDPENRMRFFCSECLTSLKGLLAGSTVHELEADRISFVAAGEEKPSSLSLQEHKVVIQNADQSPRQLHTLGDQGSLQFEKISDRGLMVTIEAKNGDASHKVAVRLEATFA